MVNRNSGFIHSFYLAVKFQLHVIYPSKLYPGDVPTFFCIRIQLGLSGKDGWAFTTPSRVGH